MVGAGPWSDILNTFHSQDDERMSKFVMDDNLKKYDTDKDGQISKKEYLGTKNAA